MNVNSKYAFKEAAIEPPFYQSKVEELKKLIDKSVTFNLISFPGIGVTQFLRYFVATNNYHFVFVDSFSLTSFSKNSFFKLLLEQLGGQIESENDQDLFIACQEKLTELIKNNTRVVIIFNRFDKLAKQFDHDFFSHIRTLRNIDPVKIVMIFTANKTLYEVNPAALAGPNLNFSLNNVYFGTYNEDDLRKLAPIYSPVFESKSKAEIDRAIKLSGGHINLFNLLLNSEAGSPTSDRFINIQLKDISDVLNYSQKNTLKNLAFGKKVEEVDTHLINLGLVKKEKAGYRIFSPILEEYFKTNTKVRLPAKESKLFLLLKKNLGKVVTKDQIFDTIWGDDPDPASDWALNALIYRLKKNPSFKNSGLILENHKKIGYTLIQG